jgi:DNA polymerase-3 subunit chi
VPDAFFYQLNGEAPEAVLPRLLDMGVQKGWRIELRGTSRERMERLDLALWGEGGEFRPHGLAGGPFDAEQPILITVGPGLPPRDWLVALDGAAVGPGDAGVRLSVVFDGNDAEVLQTARSQWKALTGAGLAAKFYVREGGSWALRQERPAAG